MKVNGSPDYRNNMAKV